MKFAIAVVVLTTVVGVYSDDSIPALPIGSKGLSPQEIVKIKDVIAKVAGPKVADVLTKLVASLANGVLQRTPRQGVLDNVTKLLIQLFKPNVKDGNALSDGKIKNLTPADQKALQTILNRTVGPYTASNIVRILATVTNGLVGKIPLSKIIQGVTVQITNLIK